MSGYSLYISENIAKLTGTQTLKFKELSEKWKNETQEIKELYSKKASLINEENKEKFESLPQEERDKLIEDAKTKRQKKDKRKNKAIKREVEILFFVCKVKIFFRRRMQLLRLLV